MDGTTAEFDDHLYSIPEAVEALRIRPSHLYKLMQENTIRPLRLGHRTLIPRSEVRRLIAQATAR
ncbi:helix-turn-helix domain-containing protein [Mycolicibacterium brisbanense]